MLDLTNTQELTMEILKLLEGRCLQRPLQFGHFPMTAERSNRIARAAVATLWRPSCCGHVTPKSQPRRRLCEVGCFSPG